MNVDTWLKHLGLEHLTATFAEHAIDWSLLRDLTDSDLKEIGVKRLGERKRILRAIAELSVDARQGAVIDTLEAERRPVTALFADLVGFTRLTNQFDDEQVQELLRDFFDAVDSVVLEYGGTIENHIGDCVMAVFGAPFAQKNDTERAVRCAIEIRKRVSRISSPQSGRLSAHIGVACGAVISGPTGGASASKSVTGASINLASRLSDHAEADEILISDEVYQLLRDQIKCQRVDDISVQGFDEALRVWRLEELEDVPHARSILIGRVHEMAQAQALLDTCRRTGSGQVIMLRGEPGIGKSRLAREVVFYGQKIGFDSQIVDILDFGAGAKGDLLRVLMRGLLAIEPDAGAHQTSPRVNELEEAGILSEDDAPFYRDLLDIPQSARTQTIYQAMDNATRVRRKLDCLERVVENTCTTDPLIILAEDAQWADPRELEALGRLAEATSRCALVLVITTRIEGERTDALWREGLQSAKMTTIDLGPLSEKESMDLALNEADLPQKFLHQCVEKAAGNPLFLEHLLHQVQKDADLPNGILSIVQSIIDRVPLRDRRALQAASVLGQRFSLAALRMLIGDDTFECRALAERRLVRSEGEQIRFSHALIQDAIYNTLLRERRHELHRKAAHWYSTRDLVIRAQHLERAEAPEAPGAFIQAAQEEASKLREARALELCDRAFSLAKSKSDRIEAGLLRAELLRDLGNIETSKNAFEELVEESSREIDACRAYIGVASCVRMLGGVKEGLRALDAARDIAYRQQAEQELAQIAFLRGCLLFSSGDVEGCMAEHSASLEHAQNAAQPALEAQAFSGLGDAHYALGEMRRSLECFRASTEICGKNALGKISVGSLHMTGVLKRYLDDFQGAIADLRQALDLAVEVGNGRSEMIANTILAEMIVDAGDITGALPLLDRATDLADQFGNRRYETYVAYERGRALLHEASRRRDAVTILENAVEVSETVGHKFVGPRLFAALALANSSMGADWKSALEQGKAVIKKGVIAHNVLWFYRDAMEAALVARDWSAARCLSDGLEMYTEREQLPWADFFVNRARVLADAGSGNFNDSIRARVKSLESYAVEKGLMVPLQALTSARRLIEAAV